MFIFLKLSQGQTRYFLMPQQRESCGALIIFVYTDSEAGDHNLILGIYIVFLMLMHRIAVLSCFRLQKVYRTPVFDVFFRVDISTKLQTNTKLTIKHKRETSV